MVSDTVQDMNQVLHNVGMAAWVGGALFGRVALNPSLTRIASHAERGAVANAAWNASNAVNAGPLAVVGLGHLGGRLTELRSSNLSDRERPFVRAMDVLTAAGVLTGVLSAVQGARFARHAAGGAVVGRVDDEDAVVLAEGEPEAAECAAHRLDHLGGRSAAVLRVIHERLDGLRR